MQAKMWMAATALLLATCVEPPAFDDRFDADRGRILRGVWKKVALDDMRQRKQTNLAESGVPARLG